MTRFILFLRSLVWTSIISSALVLTAVVIALINPNSPLAPVFLLASIAIALIGNRRD